VYAGFWIRLAAYVIDLLLIGVGSFVLYLIVFALADTGATAAQVVAGVIGLGTFLAIPAYFVVGWKHGHTLGMRMLDLEVRRLIDGGLPTTGQSLLRLLGFWLSWLPSIIIAVPLGLLWAGWDARKQGWHDKMADTLVVRRI
jgi:uncharacterized RDD family membrane protein YckC